MNKSPVCTYRPAPAVLIRRRIRGRVVNIWLVFIVVLGALIALGDGLTRTPITERELTWDEPFVYQPYPGVFLLAGTALPLMMLYARKSRMPLTEGLFLWFVFCTAAYGRDFSYLRLSSAPVFVTDAVLVVLLASIHMVPRRHCPRNPVALNVLLFLFMAAGVLSAVRGFCEHRSTLLVLRDSTLVVYPLFLFVARNLLRTWLSIKRVAVWFVLGSVLGTLNGLGWFIAAPGETRFVFDGIYVLISLVGVILAIRSRLINPWVGWIFAFVLCVGLMLANSRSLFVALVILLPFAILDGRSVWGTVRVAHSVPTLLTGAILATLAGSLFLLTEVGRDFTDRSAHELASGLLNSRGDPNWQFRLMAWKEAWRRFEEYPPAGEGFGVPFNIESWGDPRPHNTFLTVLYKMGLTGFLPLLALLAFSFWFSLGAVRRNRENRYVAPLQIVVLAEAAFCIYGAANLMLESPFLASLFWAGMGTGLRMIKKVDLERLLRVGSREVKAIPFCYGYLRSPASLSSTRRS